MNCPHCHKLIPPEVIAQEFGRSKSKAKQAAARVNGRKGGRPKLKVTV